jgi:hypothetical protein
MSSSETVNNYFTDFFTSLPALFPNTFASALVGLKGTLSGFVHDEPTISENLFSYKLFKNRGILWEISSRKESLLLKLPGSNFFTKLNEQNNLILPKNNLIRDHKF